jgi:hypothetical protein
VKLPKCYVVEESDGYTTVERSFAPFATETRRAKERAMAYSGSGRPIRIEVVENVSCKVFEVDKAGKIRNPMTDGWPAAEPEAEEHRRSVTPGALSA